MNKTAFLNFYQHFKTTDLWSSMASVTENSPWHRESSVAVHTEMVVEQYLKIFSDVVDQYPPGWTNPDWNWTRQSQALLGALASLFHDTGKPAAKQEKFKPERGNYLSFAGHEIISARLFEDYIVSNWNTDIVRALELQLHDIYTIGWMIEHHLPYQLKGDKLSTLRQTAQFSDIFTCVLRADNRGRISDDHDQKLTSVEAWIDQFNQVPVIVSNDHVQSQKNVWLLIGASGSGKSTFVKQLCKSANDKLWIHSMDTLRTLLYPSSGTVQEQYSYAFKSSTEDSAFNGKVSKDYVDMLKVGCGDVVVDNTNVSNKRRKFYITEAKRRGYRIVAVLFPNSLDTLIRRQEYRKDKNVPTEAVHRQYFSIQYPMLGDVDEVLVQSFE